MRDVISRIGFWCCGVVLLALRPATLSAAPLYCSGTLISVYMDSSGNEIAQGSWRSDYTQLCSDQGSFGRLTA